MATSPPRDCMIPPVLSGRIRIPSPGADCPDRQNSVPSVLVPLRAYGGDEGDQVGSDAWWGYLCMCGLDDPSCLSKQLLDYKGLLVQNVLNVTLTNAKLFQELRTDPLTGVGTRRVFESRLGAECARADRHRRPFCVAIVDVDRYKRINDELGHVVGDTVLKALGECMAGQKRRTDVLARYGGDEFVMLMPETTLIEAVTVMERIRCHVPSMQLPDGAATTISCGVAEWTSQTRDTAKDLFRQADLALYEAKRAGRNRTETWGTPSSRPWEETGVNDAQVAELQRRVAGISAESKEMFVQSIWTLVRALEAKDPYTRNHSENVMHYSMGIAEAMAIDLEHEAVIRRAAMIHDIGKIGVPDSILHKPGPLTRAQRRIMERHPLIAVRILDQMRFLERELPIVRHHHERWDGKGYPDGLRASSTHLGARILAVADTLDAITSERVYRKSRPLAKAMAILAEEAGQQFDPAVVEALTQWIADVATRLGTPEDVTVQHLLDSQQPSTTAA
ncbi:hypothetical protein LCGC14_2025670 [marine sediment metagenome]|uniref:Diguanylate cyclase n=1 Tax=marine sediment metagenome TaxID=412755 RepID=A0A0F9FIR8_9ZZZZ